MKAPHATVNSPSECSENFEKDREKFPTGHSF